MRDIIREKKLNNTVVGLELKCFESAHLVVSALQQLRPPSVPLACDLQIIPHRDATVGELRLLFVFVSAFSARFQHLNAGGDEVYQLKSGVNIPYLLSFLTSSGGSGGLILNKRFFSGRTVRAWRDWGKHSLSFALFPNAAGEQRKRMSTALNINLLAASHYNYHDSRYVVNCSSFKLDRGD